MIQVSAATTTISAEEDGEGGRELLHGLPCVLGAASRRRPSRGRRATPDLFVRFSEASVSPRPRLPQNPVDLVFELGDHRAVFADLGPLGGIRPRLEPGEALPRQPVLLADLAESRVGERQPAEPGGRLRKARHRLSQPRLCDVGPPLPHPRSETRSGCARSRTGEVRYCQQPTGVGAVDRGSRTMPSHVESRGATPTSNSKRWRPRAVPPCAGVMPPPARASSSATNRAAQSPSISLAVAAIPSLAASTLSFPKTSCRNTSMLGKTPERTGHSPGGHGMAIGRRLGAWVLVALAFPASAQTEVDLEFGDDGDRGRGDRR